MTSSIFTVSKMFAKQNKNFKSQNIQKLNNSFKLFQTFEFWTIKIQNFEFELSISNFRKIEIWDFELQLSTGNLSPILKLHVIIVKIDF